MSRRPMRAAGPIHLFVTLSWSNAVVAVCRLAPGEAAVVGDAEDAFAPIPVPSGVAARFVFADRSRHALKVRAPSGATLELRRRSGAAVDLPGPAAIELE